MLISHRDFVEMNRGCREDSAEKYQVRWREDCTGCHLFGTWHTLGETNEAAMTVPGLEAGGDYRFAVRAFKSGRWSDWSAKSARYWTCGATSKPGVPYAVSRSSNMITVRWNAPSPGQCTGAVTYTLVYRRSDCVGCSVTATRIKIPGISTNTYTVRGLTSGRGYKFYVSSKRYGLASDETSWSSQVNTITVPGKPGTPSKVRSGWGTITIRWGAGSSGGSPVTKYKVYCEILSLPLSLLSLLLSLSLSLPLSLSVSLCLFYLSFLFLKISYAHERATTNTTIFSDRNCGYYWFNVCLGNTRHVSVQEGQKMKLYIPKRP